jgi:hypothetical protein
MGLWPDVFGMAEAMPLTKQCRGKTVPQRNRVTAKLCRGKLFARLNFNPT